MSGNTSIQIKAAFLLVVFAFNTVVGFACSIGINMGYNADHHTVTMASNEEVHVHKDGKMHTHRHSHGGHQHSHKHSPSIGNVTSGSHINAIGSPDDCCSNQMNSFQHLDKSVPGTIHLPSPLFFIAFAATFYNVDLLTTIGAVKAGKPFVRSHHPPIPDIRIAIQSFQI